MVQIVVTFVLDAVTPQLPNPGAVPEATRGELLRQQLPELSGSDLVDEELGLLTRVVVDMIAQLLLEASAVPIRPLQERVDCFDRKFALISQIGSQSVLVCGQHRGYAGGKRL